MGELTQFEVNFHQLEDRERRQVLNFVQLKLLEYLALTNQNIQLDPVLVHLRLIARLQKWGDPNYGQCINIINQLKRMVKDRELTATILYLLIFPVVYPKETTALHEHLQDFFNMLTENKIFHYKIGPPFSAEDCLPDEKPVWKDFKQITDDIRLHMQVTPLVNSPTSKSNWGDKIKICWTVGKL